MEASTLYSPTRPGSSEKRRKRDSEVAGCCFRHDCRGTLVNCFKVRDFLVALVDAKEQLGTRCPTWPATGQWDQANLDAACCKGCWDQLSKVAKRFKDRVALLVAAAAPTPSPSRGATTPRLSDIETSTCFFCRLQGPNKGSTSDPKDRTFAGGGLWVFAWCTLVRPDRSTDLPPGATSVDPKLFAHDKCYHRECYQKAQTEHKNYMAKERKKNANAVAPPPISQNKRADTAAMAEAVAMVTATLDAKRAVTLAAVRDCYEKAYDASGGDARATKMRPSTMLQCLQTHMPGFNERVLVQAFRHSTSKLLLGADLTIGEAAVAGAEMVKGDVAVNLHDEIVRNHESRDGLRWPPLPHELGQRGVEGGAPQALLDFLAQLLRGDAGATYARLPHKQTLLADSFAADVCTAVTNGKQIFGLHLLVSMNIYHLTRKKSVIKLEHLLGHGVPYNTVLQLLTAWSTMVHSERFKHSQLRRLEATLGKSAYGCSIDNEDHKGGGIQGGVHNMAQIAVQYHEKKQPPPSPVVDDDRVLMEQRGRCPAKAPHFIPTPLEHHPVDKAAGLPAWWCAGVANNEDAIAHPLSEASAGKLRATSDECFIARFMATCGWMPQTNQTCPGLYAFLGRRDNPPEHQPAVVQYLEPIRHNPTDPDTVYASLVDCSALQREGGQKFSMITCDLGVYKIAVPILWAHQDVPDLERIIPLVGTFHLTMAALGRLGKKMSGSGLLELMVDAKLATSGTIKTAVSGKNYALAIKAHRTIGEAMDRILFTRFVIDRANATLDAGSTDQVDTATDAVRLLLSSSDGEDLAAFVTAVGDKEAAPGARLPDAVTDLLVEYGKWKNAVATDPSKLGATATLWASYTNDVGRILAVITAVKMGNLPAYITALHDLAPLFFSWNSHYYARWTTYYCAMLVNIKALYGDEAYWLVEKTFAMHLTRTLHCAMSGDLIMEGKLMRDQKDAAWGEGIAGLANLPDNHNRWLNTNALRAGTTRELDTYCRKTTANAKSPEHHEGSSPKMARAEDAVQRVMDSLTTRFTHPLVPGLDVRALHSNKAMDPATTKSLLTERAVGEALRDQYRADRLFPVPQEGAPPSAWLPKVPLSAPLKKSKCLSCASGQEKVKARLNLDVPNTTDALRYLQFAVRCMGGGHKTQLDVLAKLTTHQITRYPSSFYDDTGRPRTPSDPDTLFDHVVGSTCRYTGTPEADTTTCAILNGTHLIQSLKYGACPGRSIVGLCVGVANMAIARGPHVIIVFGDRHVDGVDYPGCRPGLSVVPPTDPTAVRERLHVARQPKSTRPGDYGAFLKEPTNVVDLSNTVVNQWCEDEHCARRIATTAYCAVYSPEAVPTEGPPKERRVRFKELRVNGVTQVPATEVVDMASTNEGASEHMVLAVKQAHRRGFSIARVESTTTITFFTLMLHMAMFVESGPHPIIVVFQLSSTKGVTTVNLNELWTEGPRAAGKPCELYWRALAGAFVFGGAHPGIPSWFGRGATKFWVKACSHASADYLTELAALGDSFDAPAVKSLAVIEGLVCEVYQPALGDIRELDKLRCTTVDKALVSHEVYAILLQQREREAGQAAASAAAPASKSKVIKPPKFDWARIAPAHVNFVYYVKHAVYILALLKRSSSPSHGVPKPWEQERGWALQPIPGRAGENELAALHRPIGVSILPLGTPEQAPAPTDDESDDGMLFDPQLGASTAAAPAGDADMSEDESDYSASDSSDSDDTDTEFDTDTDLDSGDDSGDACDA